MITHLEWVLVLVITSYSGTAAIQIGPYFNESECQRAAAVAKTQVKTVVDAGCVPKPKGMK